MHNNHFELLSGFTKYFAAHLHIFPINNLKFSIALKPILINKNINTPETSERLKNFVDEIAQYLQFQDSYSVYSFFYYSIKESKPQWFLSSAKLNKCEMGLPMEVVLFSYEIESMKDHKKIFYRVLENETFFKENFSKFSTITKREKSILQLLTLGLGSKAIAGKLNISVHTVTSHRKSINNKLGTQNINTLLRFSEVFDLTQNTI